jgi:glutamate 5-kinase
LPVGLIEVLGNFERGDVVVITDKKGKEIGKGVTIYSSIEASLIRGCRSEAIFQKLGYQGKAEIIHRDDMVLF